MTQIVVCISEIVRLHFACDLEQDSFSFNRFITHLRYLAQRIVSGVSGGKNDAFLYEQAKTNYPKSLSVPKRSSPISSQVMLLNLV